MQVFRIAQAKFIEDLSGAGTKLYGSRWTAVGVPALFTSENRALAALEFYTHLKSRYSHHELKLATIGIPDGMSLRVVHISDLPPFWRDFPAREELQDVGAKWAASGEFILKIPSVQVPGECNYILSTDHAAMKKVRIVSFEDFKYDARLCSAPNILPF